MKIGYLYKITQQILSIPFYYFSKAVKRSSDLWIFGAWHGHKYSDNPKYFFEYVTKNHPEIRAIWITKSPEVKKQILDLGYRVEYAWTLSAVSCCLRAKVVFISHDINDVLSPLLGGAICVNLTHGTPMKRIGADAKVQRLGKMTGLFDRYIRPQLPGTRKPDFIVASCESVRSRFSSAYDVDINKVLSLGYSRWESIFTPRALPLAIKNRIAMFNRVFIYAPTQRKAGSALMSIDSIPGFDGFIKWLAHENGCLVIRPHASLELTDINEVLRKYGPNVLLVGSDVLSDINILLPYSDSLISDYSSIIYDYAITCKPIIALAPDIDEYIKCDAGLYENYSTAVPGPIVQDWASISSAYNSALSSEGRFSYSEFRDRFVGNADMHSSTKIFTFFSHFLREK